MTRSAYHRGVQHVLVMTLILNLLVVVVKLVVGFMANAISVISDAVHSGADSFNNVVGLLVIRVATSEADEDHPYGHHKFESLASFGIGALLMVTCFEVGKNALLRLFRLSTLEVDVSSFTLAGMVLTILVNLAVYYYERRQGERLGSHYLVADSFHTRSDIYVSSSVLVGLLLIRIGFPWLDPVVALVITGLIAHAGWQIFQRTIPILVDAAPFAPGRVQALVMDIQGVKEVYGIRSRTDGNQAYLEFNITVDPADVYRAHLITEQIEEKMAAELGSVRVTIHVEPS